MARRPHTARRVSGSALVETLVLAVALVPLLVSIPMLGELSELRQRSVNASRFVAWQGTVGDKASQADVAERFFDRPQSHAALSPRPLAMQGMPVIDPAASGTRLEHLGSTAPAESSGAGLVSIGRALDGVAGNEWGLSHEGIGRSLVTVRLAENSFSGPLMGNCGYEADCFVETAVVLGDGWSSASDEQARRRVRALVPTSTLEPVGKLLSTFGALPVARELRDLEHAFGHVDMQVLPEYEE